MYTPDPLRLVMIGDLTDLDSFATAQTERLGQRVGRKDIQHLAHRRAMNGCPDPLIRFSSYDVYEYGDLEGWFDGYILTHPNFLGGRLLGPLRQLLKERKLNAGGAA